MDGLSKVNHGDRLKIPAEAYNAFVDAANAEKARRHGALAASTAAHRSSGIVRVVNQCVRKLERFWVVNLYAPIFKPQEDDDTRYCEEVTFRATLPGSVYDGNVPFGAHCAVVLQPLREGEVGYALLSGVVQVQIDVPTQLKYEPTGWAQPIAGHPEKLAFGPQGPIRVLWRETEEDGVQWATVLLGAVTSPPCVEFELTNALSCGGSAQAKPVLYSTGNVRITDDPPAGQIWVQDTMGQFSKMTTASGDVGAFGVAAWCAGRGWWNIVSMQTPGDFLGKLKTALSTFTWSATVECVGYGGTRVFGGYDIFQSHHGAEIAVQNLPRAGLFDNAYWFAGKVGNTVLCRWNVRRSIYQVVAVEPNDAEWQTLDVVTRTSLYIDFRAETYSHHDYTRQIKVPYWITIGNEVEH